jgi:hypothetical protein
MLKSFGSNNAIRNLTQRILEKSDFDATQLFAVQVEEGSGRLIYSIRGESTMTVSTYRLERDEDLIYRKIADAPDTVEFHILNEDVEGLRLYENTGYYRNTSEPVSDIYGPCRGRIYNIDDKTLKFKRDTLGQVISYLGLNAKVEFPKENYAFYLDTAYINRGTGWIKPQYMLVVDPYKPVESVCCQGNTQYSPPNTQPYVIGRYLYNTAMYAKSVPTTVMDDMKSPIVADKEYENLIKDEKGDFVKGFMYKTDNYNKVQPIDDKDRRKENGAAYKYRNDWERFAFAWAIHKGDSLYVLKGAEPLYKGNEVNDSEELWTQLTREYGKYDPARGGYIDFQELISKNTVAGKDYVEAYYPLGDRTPGPVARTYHTFKTMAEVKAEGRSIGLHAIIALDDNTHKDWVFSFRYVERGASDFVIESETTDRDTRYSAMIRPGYGGWLKSDNGVPVITRSDTRKLMSEASVFNVNKTSMNPVGNEGVSTSVSDVAVIGGTSSVTILNAAGKTVVISNVLGQIVANAKVTSDQATLAVPAGIVIVAVEGEKAVKVLVK